MKQTFLIIALFLSVSSFGQLVGETFQPTAPSVQMTATQTTTSIDQKFVTIQRYITDAKQQIKAMLAQESVSNNPKNKELTKQLLVDLQAIMKSYRERFMDVRTYKWVGDSLQTINQKAQLTAEIQRLKAEIAAGEDSTFIQPIINSLTNQRNDLNKIINSWTKPTNY